MDGALLAIAKSIRNRRCVFFIGSGVASEAGLVSAAKLTEVLLEELPGTQRSNSLPEIAQEYSTVHSARSLKEVIQGVLENQLENENLDRRTYELLAAIPGVDFITTNWDPLLESSFAPSKVRTIFLDNEVVFWSPERRNILKIHGCIRSPSSMVATRSEYEDYKSSHPGFVQKLVNLFAERTLVVCGYSLQDTTVREIYRQAIRDRNLAGERVFWADPYASDVYVQEWKDLGVRFLPVTSRDFCTALVRRLNSGHTSVGVASGTTHKDLRAIALSLHEAEMAFKILEHQELHDYDFFKEKTELLRLRLDSYVEAALGLVPSLDAKDLAVMRQESEQIRRLPIRVGRTITRNKVNVKVPNPQSIGILLRDLVDSFVERLEQLDTAFRRREERLEGKVFGDVVQDAPSEELKKELRGLRNIRGLEEYTHFLTLLSKRSEELADFIRGPEDSEGLKADTLSRLWQHFDIVLINERFRRKERRSRLLQALLSVEDRQMVRRASYIMSRFSPDVETLEPLRAEGLERRIESLASTKADRNIMLRCLTFHFYSEEVREFAVDRVGLQALWTLVALEGFPAWALPTVARRLLKEEGDDAAKLLLDVKFRDLLSALRGDELFGGSPTDIAHFLSVLKGEAILLMDAYNEMFRELVRATARKSGEAGDANFRELVETVDRGAEELRVAAPPGERTFRKLPKELKARLSQNMLYLTYFVTSEDDEIALLVKGMIKDSSFSARIMMSKKINRALLAWIAGRRNLMVSYAAKRALAFNPRASPALVGPYLNALRPYDVKLLSRSHEVNPAVKQLARQRLG